MPVPVFTTGEVLTAANMNAVGLWKVTPSGATNGVVTSDGDVTVNSGVSSVTVSGVFSSNYDGYKLIYSGGVGSASADIGLRLGSSTSDYYGHLVYGNYAAATVLGANDNAQNQFRFIGGMDTSFASVVCDIMSPFLSRPAIISAQSNLGAGNFGSYSGRQATTTSFTAFTLLPGTGTFTGGTIRVYGYRN